MRTLEERLGYTFRDRKRLEGALYHSSYANEHRSLGIHSNERLEFSGGRRAGSGDGGLSVPQAPGSAGGDLTRIRAALVCEESLHEVAQSLDLGSYLKLGKGEEAGGGRRQASILADATESVFAAVYLDGGLEATRALIHRVLLDKERETDVEERRRDYKTELQELVQRRSNQTLQYELVSASGPDHAKVFTSRVLLNGQPIGKGSGPQQEGGGAGRRPRRSDHPDPGGEGGHGQISCDPV